MQYGVMGARRWRLSDHHESDEGLFGALSLLF